MAKTKTRKPARCRECGKPSKYLGALSGNCPDCQNASVASLERTMGMKPGELGRVDKFGNVKDGW